MSNRFLFCLITAFLLFLTACEERVEEFDLFLNQEYFPLAVGQTRIYQVDSINYISDGLIVDSVRSLVRERITERLEDADGEEVYRLERSIRRDTSEAWQIADVWVVSRDAAGAYRTEENLRFIKLVFPLTENRQWNHNAFIDEQQFFRVGGDELVQVYRNWESRVANADTTVVVAGQEYNNVVVIIQADEDNRIEKRCVEEWYAEEVGLIYQEQLILDTQSTLSNAPWREKAEKGFIVRQQLVARN